jgi:hypothetical protein
VTSEVISKAEVIDLITRLESSREVPHPAPCLGLSVESMRDLESLLDELSVRCWSYFRRGTLEREARILGLLGPASPRASATYAYGMWHMFAEAVISAPLPLVERGRRLVTLNELIPQRFRPLDLSGGPTPADDETAALLRALIAFARTQQMLGACDSQALTDSNFARQLLGLGPYDFID